MVDVAHAAGVPAAVHMHGYPTYKSLGIPGDWKLEKGAAKVYAAVAHGPVERAVDRWLRRADAVICVSKTHCRKLAQYRPIYVPNPHPTTCRRPSPTPLLRVPGGRAEAQMPPPHPRRRTRRRNVAGRAERRAEVGCATAGDKRLGSPIPLLLGRTHALRRIRGVADGSPRSCPPNRRTGRANQPDAFRAVHGRRGISKGLHKSRDTRRCSP